VYLQKKKKKKDRRRRRIHVVQANSLIHCQMVEMVKLANLPFKLSSQTALLEQPNHNQLDD
jgi:hypothetical protein